MNENRTSISHARSYKEIGEFWDTHDLTDYWDQTEPVEFKVNIQAEATLYRLESDLSDRMSAIAGQKGVSPETLLNIWVLERLEQEQLRQTPLPEPTSEPQVS